MTIEDALIARLYDRQLARIARQKAASKKRVQESVERTLRQIDHEIKLQKIRQQAEQRRRAEEASSAETAEEASSAETVEWLMKRWRDRGGGVMQVDIAQQWLRMHLEASGPPLEPYHSLFCEYTRARGRVVRWTSTAGVNAYFLPGDGSIELWPIRSQRSAAVAWHEEAHAQTPCRTQQPPHVRVKNVGCVRCEISAWELAAQIALPEFTPDMHDEMKVAFGRTESTAHRTSNARSTPCTRPSGLRTRSGNADEAKARSEMNDQRYQEIVQRTLRPNSDPEDHDLLQRITTLEQIVLSHEETIAAHCKCIDSLLAIVEVINRRESVI